MNNYKSLTDDALVRLYEQGVDEAFDILLSRNQEKVYSYISFLLQGNTAHADDIFQDTFVRAIVAIRDHRYHDNGTFSSWLMCIARRLVFTHLRDTRNHPTVSHEFVNDEGDLCADFFNDASLCEPTVESRLLVDQVHQDVRTLITHLPQNQQEIVYLRYYRDIPFKDIAQILDISINTALGRARYAVLNLRRLSVHKDLHVAV